MSSGYDYSTARAFCPPLQGKPNPNEVRSLTGIDTRGRVIQLGLKNICSYGVFNMIRERYKAPNTENLEARKWEKIASTRKKALAAHELSLPDAVDALNDECPRDLFKMMTKEMIRKESTKQKLALLDASANIKLSSVFPDFLNQKACDNMFDYLIFLKNNKRKEIDTKFLMQLGKDPRDMLEQAKKLSIAFASLCDGKEWDALPEDLQIPFLDAFVRILTAELYGLKLSSWHPQQPISSLIEELKCHGPLAVSGNFGSPYYLVPPSKHSRIEGRDIYGWNASDPRLDTALIFHAILIVGAEIIDGQEYVYYLDPIDDSDPEHPEKQRIYVMRYDFLTSPDQISDNYGALWNEASADVGYAYHR